MRFLRPANDQRTFLSFYVGAAAVFLFCSSVWICPADGQEVGQKIQQHLDYGEFPAALQLANSMDAVKVSTMYRRVLTLLSCLLLAGSVTTGMAKKKRREVTNPVYVGGDARVPSGKLAELDARDEKVMRIQWDEGSWEIPYERITVIYVSLSRPSAMVELGSPFTLGALKHRKIYLSVRYDEENEVAGKCIFLVREGYGETVELLAERSKRNVVFETYDAKRRLKKRK